MTKMGAIISPCGKFRYELTRSWGDGPTLTWVMLNPSTADAEVNDPTIRKVIGFSAKWGYDSIRVLNLFAYRATNPKELVEVIDPVGPENLELLKSLEGPVVTAWGTRIPKNIASQISQEAVYDSAWANRLEPYLCLGHTKNGYPRHPLYVSYNKEPESWNLKILP